MELKRIYFDMDGVLADFDRGVRELCGIEPVNQAQRVPGSDRLLWERIRETEHFYDRLELMPGAKEMFDTVYGRYGTRCEILTGIPKPKRGIVSAGEDKVNWVRRLLSEEIVVHIVYREEKPDYCLGADCILIDDLEKNIENWERAGGTGILHRSAEETLLRLRELSGPASEMDEQK